MKEKSYEYSTDLQMLFLDFRQALDSVDRKRIYEVMQQIKIPDILIRLTQMRTNVTQAKVKTDNMCKI
jgi:hypothetical protein